MLWGGGDMRVVVMPLRSCSITIMLTSLRESFMEEGGQRETTQGRREKETTGKSQHQENITAVPFRLKKTTLPSFYNNVLFCQTSPREEKRLRPSLKHVAVLKALLCHKKGPLLLFFSKWWSLTWWINERWEKKPTYCTSMTWEQRNHKHRKKK